MDTSRTAIDTSVVLRIAHESRDPSEVTDLLGIDPTFVGEANPYKAESGPHGKVWVLTSRWAVTSQDNVDHLKWLTDTVGQCARQFKTLRESGFDMKVKCLWIGRKSCNGPRLTPEVMSRLAEWSVELYFHVRFIDVPAGANTAKGS